MKLALSFPAFLFVACQTSTPPLAPPPLDASALGVACPTGSPAGMSACTTMQQQNCQEGSDPCCASSMDKVTAIRLIVPTMCPPTGDCIVSSAWCATATSPAEVVAKCGSSCTATLNSKRK